MGSRLADTGSGFRATIKHSPGFKPSRAERFVHSSLGRRGGRGTVSWESVVIRAKPSK
jgi:hypothetical protein